MFTSPPPAYTDPATVNVSVTFGRAPDSLRSTITAS